MTASPDFRYWNSVDPSTFLDHDWQNPSRQWATREALKAAYKFGGKQAGGLVEVGPGPGVDYERYFRKDVLEGRLLYAAYEGSQTLHVDLQRRFPEATWWNKTIADIPPLVVDVLYARHVMEHQPALEPALGTLLAAARKAVVLTWYRPPGPVAFFEVWEGVHCQTFARAEVLKSLERHGWTIAKSENFESGDEAWLLKRL